MSVMNDSVRSGLWVTCLIGSLVFTSLGNFGSGHINAFDINNGAARGHMLTPNGGMLVIDGLWGLKFGNDAAAGPSNTLLFTAGPNGETDGLFGSITAIP